MIDKILEHLAKLPDWHAHSDANSVLIALGQGKFEDIAENIFLADAVRNAASQKDAFGIMCALDFPGAKEYLERCVEVWRKMSEAEAMDNVNILKREAYIALNLDKDQSDCAMCQYVKDHIHGCIDCRYVCPLMRIWPQGCLVPGSPYWKVDSNPSPENIKECFRAIKAEANYILERSK